MSYLTNSEADAYFETRFGSQEWDETTETNKTKALATATRYINRLNFEGQRTDQDQVNEFPRNDNPVPQDIKDATCEIALALICGRDVEFEAEALNQTGASMSIIRTSEDTKQINQAQIHNIPSSVAWALLRPYLRDGSSLVISRLT